MILEFSHATLPRQRPPSHSFISSVHNFPSRDENPIPLPPRDKNKALLAAKPRHTRKHPLIIPPTSLQRTLDKVNTVSPPPSNDINPFQRSEPVYTNNVVNMVKNPESQHFEEQIESNLNALDEIPAEHDVVDGEYIQLTNDR